LPLWQKKRGVPGHIDYEWTVDGKRELSQSRKEEKTLPQTLCNFTRIDLASLSKGTPTV